jgi:protein-S-isoprenylcysteine O-methyltransferase Ste14
MYIPPESSLRSPQPVLPENGCLVESIDMKCGIEPEDGGHMKWTTAKAMVLLPAPWAPPEKLVVLGPYRHVRNPMNSGMLLILGAEALLIGSWQLAVWMGVFFAVCAVYFPCYEEPGLERRFGAAYRQYRANVPRWIPRLRPWEGT